jgi:hypothetical protein
MSRSVSSNLFVSSGQVPFWRKERGRGVAGGRSRAPVIPEETGRFGRQEIVIEPPPEPKNRIVCVGTNWEVGGSISVLQCA